MPPTIKSPAAGSGTYSDGRAGIFKGITLKISDHILLGPTITLGERGELQPAFIQDPPVSGKLSSALIFSIFQVGVIG
jgi:hypothetical protein